MQAIVGGTAAELGGGKFANGAVTAAFVMMYNHMAHLMPHKRMHAVDNPQPWDLNADGKLSLSEANYWYKVGNGNSITVDASYLTVYDGKEYDIVLGADYFVHGSVYIQPDGTIMDGDYNFNIRIRDDMLTGIRNAATVIGQINAGQGRAYTIHYENKPRIYKW